LSSPARKLAERQIQPVRGERIKGWIREWSTAGLALAGWALTTSAIASLTSPVTWRFSAGLVLLALVGLKPIRAVVVEGLDRLSRTEKRDA
jgi:hypothetical protein